MKKLLLSLFVFAILIGGGGLPSSAHHATHSFVSKKDVTVYITKTGKKYHRAGCRYLKRSCIAIKLSEAKADGYTACGVCNPPK